MVHFSSPDEHERLQVLYRYQILDTPPEAVFDRITVLATRVLNVPIALISLVERDRIFFKSRQGIDPPELDREGSWCGQAMFTQGIYWVADLLEHPIWCNHSFVTEKQLRFYAASPLCTTTGHRLGTLCVMDYHPHPLDEEKSAILAALGELVIEQMDLRLAASRLVTTEKALKHSESRFRQFVEQAADVFLIYDEMGFVLDTNQAACDFLGYSREELLHLPMHLITSRWHPQQCRTGLLTGQVHRQMDHYRCKDGTLMPVEVRLGWIEIDEQRWIHAIARDIRDRLIVERKLKQQADRQRLSYSLTQSLRRTLHLDDILRTTVAELCQLFATDRVAIFRFLDPHQGQVVAESVVSPWLSIQGEYFTDVCIHQTFEDLSRNQRVLIQHPNIEQSPLSLCHVELLRQLEVKAYCVLPIFLAQELWGLLVVHHCTAPRQWEEWEMGLLLDLANQLEIAIQHSQLYEKTQYQAQREQAIHQVVKTMRRSLNLDQIFSTVVNELGDLLAVDRVVIVEYRIQEKVWVHVAEYRKMAEFSSLLGQKIDDENNPIAARLKTLEIVQLDDTSHLHDPINKNLNENFGGAWLLIPLSYDDQLWGSLTLMRSPQRGQGWSPHEIEVAQEIADHLAIAIEQSCLYHQLEKANQELSQLACMDGLTGVANRRRFDEYFYRQWERGQQEEIPLSLILVDIDFFKPYNDTYGHQAGDDALRQVAQALTHSLSRNSDLVARYGGEEFALILPNTPLEQAQKIAAKIQTQVADLQIPHSASSISSWVTVSMGLATIIPEPHLSPQEFVTSVDCCLYQAKAKGRNRYVANSRNVVNFFTNHSPRKIDHG
ncbi:diguanylate cyclase [Spirulina subsalsa FACHB-351]|uniref:Diguanylate cyclase n=1 Tax=Spirulina subsalsa FACHB-351 TaxID=234711 RepID=A0ABT3L079_9CYAN|nr:GAF domain-containing protein [Spirulina subsalsa]MCW6034904.1 diguanylate cyclase [Spirulina subsalsa FACHB-351]